MCVLRVQAGRSGLHPLHQSQPHPLSERLLKVRAQLQHRLMFWENITLKMSGINVLEKETQICHNQDEKATLFFYFLQ